MTNFPIGEVIFYFFSALAVGSAISVITSRHPVRSVLSLVLTFFAMSGVWMLLQAEFLSLILLLVYVGAVMTLFLFVVMMLRVDQEANQTGFVKSAVVIAAFLLLLFGFLIKAIYVSPIQGVLPNASTDTTLSTSNLVNLGLLLYTDYVYLFEVAGLILLAAMIAAITLAFRGPMRRKQQQVSEQLSASPSNRVRIVDMPSETKQRG